MSERAFLALAFLDRGFCAMHDEHYDGVVLWRTVEVARAMGLGSNHVLEHLKDDDRIGRHQSVGNERSLWFRKGAS